MVLQRPDGRVWCAAKAYYPGHIARLLTGGIHPHEDVTTALHREIAEETGLIATHVQPLLHVVYEGVRPFQTFVYVCAVADTPPQSHDPAERIHHFEALTPHELRERAHLLTTLPAVYDDEIGATWHAWGTFRAICHTHVGVLLDVTAPPRS
jgi:8-oxo-dGTP pyrophosphatase MutT (NUDIX family)